MKTILLQDDCAPDAMQTFEAEFKKITGESRNTFIKTSRHCSLDGKYTSYYIKGKYRLSISADDPYWKLEESIKTHNLKL
jgi:hypothetical protein